MTELTRREAQTLALICLGYDSASAALVMGVSKRTVDFHLGNIFLKTPSYKTPRNHMAENRFDLAHAWGFWGKPLDELRRIAAGRNDVEKSKESGSEVATTESGNSNVRDSRMARGCTLRAD